MHITYSTEAIRGNRAHVARQAAEVYKLLIAAQNRRNPGRALATLHIKDSQETDWVDGFQFAKLQAKVEVARAALMELVFELSPNAGELLGMPAVSDEECES